MCAQRSKRRPRAGRLCHAGVTVYVRVRVRVRMRACASVCEAPLSLRPSSFPVPCIILPRLSPCQAR